MLPCRRTCADYYEGCHKTCLKWQQIKKQNKDEQEKKKKYLEHYLKLSKAMNRQCRQVRFETHGRAQRSAT